MPLLKNVPLESNYEIPSPLAVPEEKNLFCDPKVPGAAGFRKK